MRYNRVFAKIICIFIFSILILAFVYNIFNSDNINGIGGIIAYLILIAIIVGIGYLFYRVMKWSMALEKEKRVAGEQVNAVISGTLKHVAGLPVAEGVYVNVFYTQDNKIVFIKEKKTISLKCNKIESIDSCRTESLQKTLSGAASGKYLFGGISGAAIGAIAAGSGICLVISYKDEDETKFILLEEAGLFPSKLKKIFKNNNKIEDESIEL